MNFGANRKGVRTQMEKSKKKKKSKKRGAKGKVTKAIHTQDPDPTPTFPEGPGDILVS